MVNKTMQDNISLRVYNNANGVWEVPEHLDTSNFDFNWRPEKYDKPYIHQFGTQWQKTGGPKYVVHGATETKYVDIQKVKALPNKNNWVVPENVDDSNFDYSWHPDENEPPLIYQFGTQWQRTGGPKYVVHGGTEVKYVDIQKVVKLPEMKKFKTNIDIPIKFDYSWHPDESEPPFIYAWGTKVTPAEYKPTVTYNVQGATNFKYMGNEISYDSLSMFWVDFGIVNDEQYNIIKNNFPHCKKIRFFNDWISTLKKCESKTDTKLFWVLSSNLNYSQFNFDFWPPEHQFDMIHVFGNQWHDFGHTFLINSDTLNRQLNDVTELKNLQNLNFVSDNIAYTISNMADILYIEHGNNNTKILQNIANNKYKNKIYKTKYKNSYLATIKNWIENNKTLLYKKHYNLWIISSVCKYDDFDFSWIPDPYQQDQLHVFGTKYKNTIQKFGDTFYIDIVSFFKNYEKITSLENYKKNINFIENSSVERLEHPIIEHTYDTQSEAIKNIKNVTFPYFELFSKNNSLENITCPPLNLWVEENRPIINKATGATNIILPINSLSIIKNQLYDYPHILELSEMGKSKNLDIVFISNGESIAEENYLHLCDVLAKNNVTNRVVRVKNINGRLESQYAAANASETDWYFLINGKLRVDENFDWSWQPDRLQQQKHYIFMAKNPVNGLVYGHQAIVANNKHLTLTTVKTGLDFTMDSLHAVVEKMSGTALYNTDQWTAWRTAFREAIKLKNNSDYISKFRLSKWCSDGTGDFAEWSQRGALDGVEYWENVGGDLEELLHSYDWDWIHKYYNKKYVN